MKSFLRAVVLAVVLGAGLAPVSVSVSRGVALQANVAEAVCASNQVEIGTPIIGTNKCVSNDAASGGAIVVYMKMVLKFLSGAVGLVVLLMLIVSGIQYITSAGDPSQIKAAKSRLVNAITALVLFLMAFAILSFIIPGGILS